MSLSLSGQSNDVEEENLHASATSSTRVGALGRDLDREDFEAQLDRVVHLELADGRAEESAARGNVAQDREVRVDRGRVVDAEREANRRVAVLGNVDVREGAAPERRRRRGRVVRDGVNRLEVGAKDCSPLATDRPFTRAYSWG